MFHTPLEIYPSSSIYPPLYSGNKSDFHNYPSLDRVVCEEEPTWVIMTMSEACPQTPYPRTLPLKRDLGPHQHNELVKI